MALIKINLQNLILKLKKMKKVDATATTKRDFDELISQFSKEEILDLHAMSRVRGGDGDGGGDLVIIPKKEG
jgi:hypothetical protein